MNSGGRGNMPCVVNRRAPFQRLSIRAALALGIVVTLCLWLFTSYSSNRRMDSVERQAAAVAARYSEAQELLDTVQGLVLASATQVRDVLLNPDPASRTEARRRLAEDDENIKRALDSYEPVLPSAPGQDEVQDLRDQAAHFYLVSLDSVAFDRAQSTAVVRDLLNRSVVPARDVVTDRVQEMQGRNRAAFVRQQADIAALHREVGRQNWWWLGLALAVGLGVLVVVATYSGRLEGQLRRQMERESAMSRDLHEATLKLIGAQEEERRTIARELHDEVGQVLTALQVELGLADRKLASAGVAIDPLKEAQTLADSALASVRDLSQLLRPAALDDLGLPAAIDASLRGMARRHEIKVELSQVGMDERLAPETEIAAYRIVQEALTNVARHAAAAHCRVRLTRLPDLLRLEVEDDGGGFDPDGARPVKQGVGLIGMRERAALLGGSLRILSAPGAGTRLFVELPAGAARA
jgi:signal transduction histidine kinase